MFFMFLKSIFLISTINFELLFYIDKLVLICETKKTEFVTFIKVFFFASLSIF
jgi:hypothetical protein